MKDKADFRSFKVEKPNSQVVYAIITQRPHEVYEILEEPPRESYSHKLAKIK
jgi:hypothetical protein